MYPFDNSTYVRSYLTTYLTADVQKFMSSCHDDVLLVLMDMFVSSQISLFPAITVLSGSGRGCGMPFGGDFGQICTDGV